MYVKTSQSDLIFEKLAAESETIDAELGFNEEVDWEPNPEKLACRIGTHRPADLADRESWPELYQWAKDRAEKVKAVFADRVKNMQLPATDAQAAADTIAEETGGNDIATPAVEPAAGPDSSVP